MDDKSLASAGYQEKHPISFSPVTFGFLVILSLLGAIVGIQLLVTLGVTPNTSIIGAMIAMILARLPMQFFVRFRSVQVQNLAQSAISAATFGAANSLLLPIAIPFLFGRPDLMTPMFVGVALAMLLDGFLLYRMFDSTIFPAEGAWPPGVAAAEAIKAGDEGGARARLLGIGILVGAIGSWFKIPMSAFGTAFIGNIWALTMFGVGLLLRGYSQDLFGTDIAKAYIPHGVMIGAGVVALIQVIVLVKASQPAAGEKPTAIDDDVAEAAHRKVLGSLQFGSVCYIALAGLIAVAGGLYSEMSVGMLLAFVIYAAFAAFMHELIVGLAAMHSGWFPAFAVALITLVLGILIGFPPVALALLVGFSAATGPAFADMGYDLKAGFMLRGYGADRAFEMEGRRQQLYAAMIAFVVAIPVVYLVHAGYFQRGLVPPIAKVYIATINAGVATGIAKSLLIWAVPGALIQWLGGPKRQLGVMLATGLLIAFPMAGWAVLVGIAIRMGLERFGGPTIRNKIEVFAGGVIAGDALFSFFYSTLNTKFTSK